MTEAHMSAGSAPPPQQEIPVWPSDPTPKVGLVAWLPLVLSIVLIVANATTAELLKYSGVAWVTIVLSVLAVLSASIPLILAQIQNNQVHALAMEHARAATARASR